MAPSVDTTARSWPSPVRKYLAELGSSMFQSERPVFELNALRMGLGVGDSRIGVAIVKTFPPANTSSDSGLPPTSAVHATVPVDNSTATILPSLETKYDCESSAEMPCSGSTVDGISQHLLNDGAPDFSSTDCCAATPIEINAINGRIRINRSLCFLFVPLVFVKIKTYGFI
jgi:hypothetical protein